MAPVTTRTVGKVTARCLWTACKALVGGACLIVIGATMAAVGFYADDLSLIAEVVDGNRTIHSRDITLNKHLTNLSYVGPIVMGVGGFVIVATCVMTFEARDSAAKVVPARIRAPIVRIVPQDSQELTKRNALTANFIQFSRQIQTSIESSEFNSPAAKADGHVSNILRKCPSAPNLVPDEPATTSSSPCFLDVPTVTYVMSSGGGKRLHPGLPRQARSMDATRPPQEASEPQQETFTSNAAPSIFFQPPITKTDSATSMALDLYLPDCAITLKVQDESRPAIHVPVESPLIRRETTKRHPLLRQEQVEQPDSDGEDG